MKYKDILTTTSRSKTLPILINDVSGEHADDNNDNVVDVYVIFHRQSPINDVLKQVYNVHVIQDRQISPRSYIR